MTTETSGDTPSTAATAPPITSVRAGWRARPRVRRGGAAVCALLVALALVPLLYDTLFGFSAGFELHRLSLIGIFVLAAFAQNVLTGYAAQPSLGNAAFFGVGAYLLAWLTNDLGQPYLVGIVAAMAASAVLGVIVGGPALRISGAYLAIATLGLVFITGSLLDLWDTTAGRQSYDLNVLPGLLIDDHSLYYTVLVVAAVILFLGRNVLRSRVGRAWVAIRDSEAAAEAFGVNVTRYKLLAFVVSAAVTGLAGALYATWATTASSSMSSADQTIAFLTMIIVGGLGSIAGSVLGAAFVGFLPLLLGQLPDPITIGEAQVQVATLTTGIYGLLLLLALIFFPSGLSSLGARLRPGFRRITQRGAQ
ncbi:MAG TPA: branched-chain amino acid ABC transporter permease [Ktedonobacterales bacterium]|nr:branched-chain amino acid ABC transporter permease [Ktedonobacterales bacterium]